ncbi:hypothetical protein Kuja_1090 [Vibrio phage vB_VchM_Kuja]|uniref:Uncharacterized protein n=1 Tax=Vibrio phage vB_VchM_Kuja TaxID=2686437 RepID=A0A6B9J589_9CAUD|nr:hypothetical protein HWC83_gp127 [Vibrio phage vB_VchM_Kuja]QGZ16100.1 hypothetical protein Kuja_1090 [Vibrio phage vB_VchM_Kuja]
MSKQSKEAGLEFIIAKLKEAWKELLFTDRASLARGTAALQDARSRIVNHYDIDVDHDLPFEFVQLSLACGYAEDRDYGNAVKHLRQILNGMN